MTAFTKDAKFVTFESDKPVLYVYTDMRNHAWHVKQSGTGEDAEWQAFPSVEAAKAYDLPTELYFVMAFGDGAAKSLIDGIESRLEAARAAGETPGAFFSRTPSRGIPWWLWALGLYAWHEHNKGRRR